MLTKVTEAIKARYPGWNAYLCQSVVLQCSGWRIEITEEGNMASLVMTRSRGGTIDVKRRDVPYDRVVETIEEELEGV